MEKQLNFRLHAKQLEVWKSNARFRVLVAGRRWGKTWMAITDLIISALSNPKAYYFYVAPSYRQAKHIAWRTLKDFMPSEVDCNYNESELSCELPNGSRIELKGADNEDSLLGVGLDGMVIDEFATLYNNWQVWHTVLRPMLSDKKGWVLFIGTPRGKDALWELYMKGQRGEDNYQSWQFKTIDNPFIDVKEVEEARTTMPERYFRQEYEASFEDYTGLIWPEFNSKTHVIAPHYIDKQYVRIGAIDTAVSGITGVLKAYIDEDGVITIYEEYYERDKRVGEVAEAVREEDVQWFIDPSSASKNILKDGKLYNLYNEYTDNGIYARPAENDVAAGINRTAEHFKSGKIRIFSTCKNLIWELSRYHYAESRETIKGEIKAEPYKKDDHLCDALRYIVMGRHITSISKLKPEPGVWSPAWDIEQSKKESENWERQFV